MKYDYDKLKLFIDDIVEHPFCAFNYALWNQVYYSHYEIIDVFYGRPEDIRDWGCIVDATIFIEELLDI